jgi:hypothetical protein
MIHGQTKPTLMGGRPISRRNNLPTRCTVTRITITNRININILGRVSSITTTKGHSLPVSLTIRPTLTITKRTPTLGIRMENITDINRALIHTMAKSLVTTHAHIVNLDLKTFSRHQLRTKFRVI